MPRVKSQKPPSFVKGEYEINYLSTGIICIPPVLWLGAVLAGVPLDMRTFAVAVFFYFFNGMLGITVGYHRLFSHKAFKAHWTLEWVLAVAGAGAFQGSCKWWGRNHRIHHRYIDTDEDPYNATRGFVYTHVGWMMMKQNYDILGRVDIKDFHRSFCVMFQHKFYLPIALASGIIAPTLICGYGWGDWLGGYFYAGMAKAVLLHHCTFFINSLAHCSLFGRQNYSKDHSSQDSALCAVLTFGEGYHNFHHEFANDYRNGIKWYHYDPTKWFIRLMEMCGLAYDLVRTPNDVVSHNVNSVKKDFYTSALRKATGKIDAMVEAASKDVRPMTMADVVRRCAEGDRLVVIKGGVYDLHRPVHSGAGYTHSDKLINWYSEHPGGKRILDAYVGKDATHAFYGGVYKHYQAAENLLVHLKVGTIVE